MTTSYGYIYPLTAGKGTSFPITNNGPVQMPAGATWVTRLDFSAPNGNSCDDYAAVAGSTSGGCNGTVSYTHRKGCY